MSESRHVRVLIIGSGPAGYTAAIYAARAALAPVLIEGLQPGGQLTITTEVENWPGDLSVQGPNLMVRMAEQARHVGAELVSDIVTNVDMSRRPFAIQTDSGQHWTADTVIICTGAQARWLGIESETRYRGFGVSACATCDGFFFRGRTVVVVGGGNTAVEEAMFLTNFATKVHLVHRRDELRADKTNQARLFAHDKIEIHWDSEIADVEGSADPLTVTGVTLRDTRTGALRPLACDGLFIAIGHVPATSLFVGQLEMDDEGYLITRPDSTATSVPGVFAAGDVKDKLYRQAVTAAGMGCMAALEAERFMAHGVHELAAAAE
ncbi:thioredoxin-disulfide reductase [Polymorphobacter fuscus]|uniref:Thioredoxin reductase n=1 Tax=Sandarakinorhabdus fusca TaxID=1439888 RepID=A0A7C9GMY6_9SPHN|nr:thioredoxin-disulfide reductase [Polymorphobacter fuscus]KAB7648416.1 thioredoxin-disulfide reductase [Polymorphobacter fuscus]MQT15933.1 thioredoxin-disulfide reductase [Polymorphobacter fuscus]NJC07791.1 thioredoxin reductase (NADPH) [Polymorphobacter fuscus]